MRLGCACGTAPAFELPSPPILALAAVLGMGTALFIRFALQPPDFSFWTMVTISASCVIVLMLYYALMHLLAPR